MNSDLYSPINRQLLEMHTSMFIYNKYTRDEHYRCFTKGMQVLKTRLRKFQVIPQQQRKKTVSLQTQEKKMEEINFFMWSDSDRKRGNSFKLKGRIRIDNGREFTWRLVARESPNSGQHPSHIPTILQPHIMHDATWYGVIPWPPLSQTCPECMPIIQQQSPSVYYQHFFSSKPKFSIIPNTMMKIPLSQLKSEHRAMNEGSNFGV